MLSNVNKQSSRPDSKSKRALHVAPRNENEVGLERPTTCKHNLGTCCKLIAEYEPQSEICSDTVPSSEQHHTLTTFYDENPSFTCSTKTTQDPTRDSAQDGDAMLSTFFERPIVIDKSTWTVGGTLNKVYEPWGLWSANPRVRNRMANFRNFRGDLHLKVVINGNAFYWGSAILSYQPYNENSSFIREDATYIGDKMQATQRPHIMLDPTTSQGGQLDLPFFWHDDNVDITQNTMNRLGSVWLTGLVNLENTQSTQSITITTYAWLTNVKLSGPTQVNPIGLLPQADEYNDGGPISKPAAIVSKIAGKLETTPVIGKYAMATKMAANTVGTVARALGYSKPLEISNPQKYKNTQTGDLATTDTVDTCVSLGMSSKKEVTIDPSTTGLSNVDELMFKNLYQKESYLCSVPWRTTDTSDNLLFSAPVTPMLVNSVARDIPASIVGRNLAPCGYVALPFRYWKGRMRIRFQFVGSAFHKGRVKLSWDPAFGQSTVEDNTTFNQIVDVADQRDFSMVIGWGSHQPALSTGGAPATTNYSLGAVLAPGNGLFHNGMLKLSVVNTLVFPATTTADVAFNVFVSFEDLEVFDPDSDNFQLYSYFPVPPAPAAQEYEEQSASHHIGDSTPVENAAPDSAPLINEIGGSKMLEPAAFMHGDPVVSFRQAMKRYAFVESIVFQESAAAANMNSTLITRRAVPLYRGPQVGGYHGNDEVVCPMTMFAYIAGAFSGWRGSVRYKVYNIFPELWRHSMTVSRGGSGVISQSFTSYSLSSENITQQRAAVDESFSGRAITCEVMGHILEFEIPWYANRRFAPTHIPPNTNTAFATYRIEVSSLTRPNDIIESRQVLDIYQSMGEDMNFFYFRGVPTLYFFDRTLLP